MDVEEGEALPQILVLFGLEGKKSGVQRKQRKQGLITQQSHYTPQQKNNENHIREIDREKQLLLLHILINGNFIGMHLQTFFLIRLQTNVLKYGKYHTFNSLCLIW